MDQAEEFDRIVDRARQAGWSAALIDAITDYLNGASTLAEVDQAWQRFNNRAPLRYLSSVLFVSQQDRPLDARELRHLDLFLLFGEIRYFLYYVSWRDVGQQIADHLRGRGMAEQTIRQHFFSASYVCTFHHDASRPETLATLTSAALTPLGRYLLTYLPTYTEEMFNAQEKAWRRFFRLLLLVQPPVPELVWQMAQQLEHQKMQLPDDLTLCAALLLKADPARYAPWARCLASQSNPLTSQESKLAVLKVLMDLDPEQHIDLVQAAAQLPITTPDAHIQSQAMQMGYAHDPVRFLPLVEGAVVTRHASYSSDAWQLLEKTPFEQACPALQRCVVESYVKIAERALQRLLEQPWAGQQAFLLTLLTHRAKRIRARAAWALTGQGVAIP